MAGSRLANKANAAVEAYFEEKLTPEAKKAKAAAIMDLYEGPGAGGMSFTKAIRILSDWWDEEGSDVWYEIDTDYVLDSEPKGYEDDSGETDDDGEPIMVWVEPEWGRIVHYDSSDAKRVFFGSELAPHV